MLLWVEAQIYSLNLCVSQKRGAAISVKSSDVCPEEITESNERPDSFDVGGCLGVLVCFELVLSGLIPSGVRVNPW